MSYSAQTFVADEQPTTAKWNILWSNDASFNDGSGFVTGTALVGIPSAAIKQEAFAAWTPTHAGFSVNPTVAATYGRFGNWVALTYVTSVGGTSNSGTFTVGNMPFAAKRAMQYSTGSIGDNTAPVSIAGRIDTTAASTSLAVTKDMAGNVFTSSGSKNVNFQIIYEAN